MIGYAETLSIIEKIVAEKGEDYVYTNDPKTVTTANIRGDVDLFGVDADPDVFTPCYYRQYDGTPGCIVGNYFAALNPDFSVKEGENVSTALFNLELPVTLKTKEFLSRLQQEQDRGMSWGKALESAKISAEKTGHDD